jgi:hypothetical protein
LSRSREKEKGKKRKNISLLFPTPSLFSPAPLLLSLTLLMPLDHVVGVAVVGGHQPPPPQRLADLEELSQTLVDEGAGAGRRGEVTRVPDLILEVFFSFGTE